MSFVHLHVHTQYSLLEAPVQTKALVKKAAEYKMPAVGITDYGNMFGAIEFYFAAKDAAVKPIIGLEAYIAPGSRHQKGEARDLQNMPNRRIVLLATSFKGYQNLCQISTIGYKEGFYYRPRIDYEVLREFNEDIIALSGGLMGEVPWTFINKGPDEALNKIRQFKEIYQDRFYLEMNRTGVKAWQEINPFLLEAQKITGVPVVAANDVHFLKQEDQVAQEVLICIGSNKTLQDESRYRLGSDQFYFKDSDQMQVLFKDVPEALRRTIEIADRCKVEFKLKDAEGKPIYLLPSYPTQEGRTVTEEIKALALEGLKLRFEEAANRGEPISDEQKIVYNDRLNFELDVISKMGFNGYFLIVQDFIKWAKENDIPVGPGRGSGAGSLVAYSLSITDLDPMPYQLLFERFLNPERISMPDFDIDFCQENRGRVIEYVTQKYGQDSVSQIITYGKLQARAALRDVGRVMGMGFSEVDVVAKLIPEKLGITLEEAIEMEPRLRDLMESDPKINTMMDLARKIEGLVRHVGIHAAGVVIAEGRLIDHAPLYRGVEGENVVQYDMKHAEKIGLIKFDFLGLKTLTHIQNALQLIEKNRDKKYTTKEISLKDPGIYSIMCKGDTAGIFQFEGEGITDLIRKAKPTCFEDIVAINALYRPGPMDMIPDYLARKSGSKDVNYMFPELEEILKDTYGIVVYQEQVQLVASKIASYSLGEADVLRRAMGKKIASEMEQQKERFLRGAKDNGFDSAKAEELFDTMAEFAKYGFNKSHAAAYCVVAAYTAWLKNYYPVEFFAALLSTEMGDTDKVVKYVKDAQRRGIEVCPPHINQSEFNFNVGGEKIYFSLGAIKGVGQSAVDAIVEARASQPDQKFASLEDFFGAVDLRRVNKKTIECLIRAGAFDSFGYNRNELMGSYVRFIERADRKKRDNELGQTSLFALDVASEDLEAVHVEKRPAWSRAERLAAEKEVLGFYLSDHPLNGLEGLLSYLKTQDIASLGEMKGKPTVRVLGLVSSMREIITKKGTRMAFAQFEDLSGALELVVFPDAYAKSEISLKSEGPLILSGQLEISEEGAKKILVEGVEPYDAKIRSAKKLIIQLDEAMTEKLSLLKEFLNKHPGETPLQIRVELADVGQSVDLDVTEPRGIQPSPHFIEGLQGLLGSSRSVEFL